MKLGLVSRARAMMSAAVAMIGLSSSTPLAGPGVRHYPDPVLHWLPSRRRCRMGSFSNRPQQRVRLARATGPGSYVEHDARIKELLQLGIPNAARKIRDAERTERGLTRLRAEMQVPQ